MSKVAELEKLIEDEGIVQISGGIFKDHNARGYNRKTKRFEDGIRRANCTVESYCAAMGAISGLNVLELPILDPDFDFKSIDNPKAISAEEYAASLLRVQGALESGDCKVIHGECPKCSAFIAFGEAHDCSVNNDSERIASAS